MTPLPTEDIVDYDIYDAGETDEDTRPFIEIDGGQFIEESDIITVEDVSELNGNE